MRQVHSWLWLALIMCFCQVIFSKELQANKVNMVLQNNASNNLSASLLSVSAKTKDNLLAEAEEALKLEMDFIKKKARDFRYKLLGINTQPVVSESLHKPAQLLETNARQTNQEFVEKEIVTETGEREKVRFSKSVFNRKKMRENKPTMGVSFIDTSSSIKASEDDNELLRRAIEQAEREADISHIRPGGTDVRNLEVGDFFEVSDQEVQAFLQQAAESEAAKSLEEKKQRKLQEQRRKNIKKRLQPKGNRKSMAHSFLQVNNRPAPGNNPGNMQPGWPFEPVSVPSMAYSPPGLSDGPQVGQSYSINKPADQIINHFESSPRENSHQVTLPIFPSTNPPPLAPNEKPMDPSTMYMQGSGNQFLMGAVPTASSNYLPSMPPPQHQNLQLNEAALHDSQFYGDTPFYPTQNGGIQLPPAAIEQPMRGDGSSPYGNNIPNLPFQQVPSAPMFR